MAKRTARQIRIDAMEEVRRKDAERRPNRPNRPAFERFPTKRATREKRVLDNRCCMEKHEGNLPAFFKPCADCSNNEATQTLDNSDVTC